MFNLYPAKLFYVVAPAVHFIAVINQGNVNSASKLGWSIVGSAQPFTDFQVSTVEFVLFFSLQYTNGRILE